MIVVTDAARLRRRCDALLEQALGGSEHGEVRFRFEDGAGPLSGHRAALCTAREDYAGWFSVQDGGREGGYHRCAAWVEDIIGVPPWLSEAGYRVLTRIQWLYQCSVRASLCFFLFHLCFVMLGLAGRTYG